MVGAELTKSRDSDAWIVEHVFHWKTEISPPDYDGKNASEILVPPGGIPKGYSFPRKGIIHRAFFCSMFYIKS